MDDIKNDTIPAALPTAGGALYLTQEQVSAASLWEIKDTEEIAAALDILSHVLTEWEDLPLFMAEITDHRFEIDASIEEKQAAALVFDNWSYAEAETVIGLEEGTIMEWAQEHDSPFNELPGEMKRDYGINTIQPEIADEIQNEPDSHNLSEDQMLAIPLIIETQVASAKTPAVCDYDWKILAFDPVAFPVPRTPINRRNPACLLSACRRPPGLDLSEMYQGGA